MDARAAQRGWWSGRACRTRRWLAVGLLALGACGGDDSGSSGDDDSSNGESAEDPGPLAELMGWTPSEPAEDRRRQLQIEELTAECMRAEGWEYEPVDYSAMGAVMEDPDADLRASGPDAYGEKYGYGVMRNYELYEAAYLEDPEAAMEEQTDFVDPNAEYVESLSPDEQQEYYTTLYGEQSMTTVDETEGTTAAVDMSEMGCSGQANAEVYAAFDVDPDVQARVQEYFEGLEDEPRLQSARDEWVECMGDMIDGLSTYDGSPVEQPDDMWEVFDSLKYEAQGLEAQPFEDQSEIEGENYTSMMTTEDGSGVAWIGEPEAIPAAEVAELTELEVATWTRDQECQDESDLATISRQLEQDFADRLLEEFPELAPTGGD